MKHLAGLALLIVSCAATPADIADTCAEWHDDQRPLTYFSTPALERGFGGYVQLARATADDGAGSFLLIRIGFERARMHSRAHDAAGARLPLHGVFPPTCPPMPPLDYLEGDCTVWVRVGREWLELRRHEGVEIALDGDSRGSDVVTIPARYVDGFLLALDRRP